MRMVFNKKHISLIILFLFIHSGLIKWLPWPIDPTVLFFGLLLVLMIFQSYNRIVISKSTIIILLCIVTFFIFIGLTSFYTLSDRYWQIKTVRIYFHLIALILPFVFIREKNDFVAFKRIYIAFTLVALMILYWDYWSNGLRIILVSDESLFSEPTGLPDYLSISFFLATAILLLQVELGKFEFIVSLLSFLMIIILGARGPLLFVVLCLVIYYRKKLTLRQVSVFGIALGIFIVIAFDTNYFERTTARFQSLLNFSSDKSSSERLLLLNKSLEMIKERPLLGTGIGGYSMAFNKTDQRLSPHNIFLEIITEFGVIGILMFLILMLIIFLKLLRNQRNDFVRVLNFICLFYFFELLISSIFEDLRIPFFWLGLVLAMKSNKNNIVDVRN